jgi:hypothetical protein
MNRVRPNPGLQRTAALALLRSAAAEAASLCRAGLVGAQVKLWQS